MQCQITSKLCLMLVPMSMLTSSGVLKCVIFFVKNNNNVCNSNDNNYENDRSNRMIMTIFNNNDNYQPRYCFNYFDWIITMLVLLQKYLHMPTKFVIEV